MPEVLASRSPPSNAPARSQAFIARQRAILRVLSNAPAPLSTRDLRRRASLVTSEIRSACAWLKANGFVDCHVKRIRTPAFDGTALQLMAFWFLTEKGAAFLRASATAE